MNKAALSVLLVTLLLLVTHLSAEENLVLNETFDGGKGQKIFNWQANNINAFSRVPSPTNPGQMALKIEKEDDHGTELSLRQNNLRIEAGKTYKLSYNATAADGNKYTVYVETDKPTYTSFGKRPFVKGTGETVHQELIFKFEELDAKPYIVLMLFPPGSLIIDSLSIVEVKE